MTQELQAFFAAFLASAVELVEALTIVLAVGIVRGWKPALAGALAAIIVLSAAIAIFGRNLRSLENPEFKLILGTLLLMFGLRWLRKAILRAAGVLKLRDEGALFEKEKKELERGVRSSGFDVPAAITSFNGVFIEGLEVVFIVFAVSSAGAQTGPAILGAATAAVIVVVSGVILRRPLTKVPENFLKLAVGVLVSSFGTFWVGEGLRLNWPWNDFALLLLSGLYALTTVGAIALARSVHNTRSPKGVV